MELVFVALPVALLIGGGALLAFIWAARTDQFEDLDSPPERVLFDDPPARGAGAHATETANPGHSAGDEAPRSVSRGLEGSGTADAARLCVKPLDRR